MTDKQPIRILIVDDHPMLRSGLREFIAHFDDMTLIGEAKNGAEAVQKCSEDPPDVVLMDLVMPGMNGSEATRRILEENQKIKVIILTSFYEREMIEKALQAGAASYLLKEVSSEDLAVAIRLTHAGQSILSPKATEVLIDATRQKPSPNLDLTEREKDVLELLVDGLSNAQIAALLSISTTTVKFHVGEILSKLDVSNRHKGVSVALQKGLVKRKQI